MPLKLAVVNVGRLEWPKQTIEFLERERPGVMAFQEFPRSAIREFERRFEMRCHGAISGRHPELSEDDFVEVCTFVGSNIRMRSSTRYYCGSEDAAITGTKSRTFSNHPLLVVDYEDTDGSRFRIANTHFPWAPDGGSNEAQWQALPIMLEELSKFGDLIFVGDLNAPRGKEVFGKIAERYRDWVPAEYTTSIDPELHRAREKKLQLMVDVLFTTNKYEARDVRLVFGVSDHAGIVATIEVRS